MYSRLEFSSNFLRKTHFDYNYITIVIIFFSIPDSVYYSSIIDNNTSLDELM